INFLCARVGGHWHNVVKSGLDSFFAILHEYRFLSLVALLSAIARYYLPEPNESRYSTRGLTVPLRFQHTAGTHPQHRQPSTKLTWCYSTLVSDDSVKKKTSPFVRAYGRVTA